MSVKLTGIFYQINLDFFEKPGLFTEVDAVNFVGSQDTTVIEMCALVDFLLDIVSIETYVETASEHLPNLFKSIVSVLNDKVQDLTTLEVTKALQLAKKLLRYTYSLISVRLWNFEDGGS